MASSAPSMSLQATVTVPSSSTSIKAPVASWIERIILPPGPISRPIFSGSMCVRSSRGAQAEISGRGREMVVSIFRRISIRASRAWASVAAMISSLMPLIFRSSWMPVMPFCVPAILKSMSP